MPKRRATPSAVQRISSTTELRAAGLTTDEIRVLKKARSPLAWLRPVLLVLGILAIGFVVLMLAAYRFGKGTEDLAPAAAEGRAPEVGERVLAGRGFDYTQTSEGVTLFRIRAEESRQDRDGTSYLTTVSVSVNHENGQTYNAESRNATFKEETLEARLEGDVVLSGWDDLELRARALEFRQGGQVLESDGAVEFSFPPELTGRASKLRVDRSSDTITLSDGVHLHTVAAAERPMRLDCQRLVYQRSTGVVRAVGEASLKTDRESLAAHYLTIFLAADGRTLESVRARWNVVGRSVNEDPSGDTTEVVYRGEFLDVQPEAADPGSRRIKLDGEGDEVTLAVTDLTGLRRSLTGLYLIGKARGDRLVQVEGVGRPIVLAESLDMPKPFPLRRACAERLTARFLPGGGLARVQLENRVELNDQGLSLSGGEKAALNLEDGSFRVEGEEVLLLNSQGEVLTKQLSWRRDKGIIRARDGVRAILSDRSLGALRNTPLGRGKGPVQVESEEAYWTTDPATFAFEGRVRAWRGDSLLLADQLLGADKDRKLAASGGVRTVWTPDEGATLPAGTPGSEPIEVTAERVSYLDEGRKLVYHENVELNQGRRVIACQELGVALDAAGRAEQMTCVDDVRMEDPESGRRVEGGDRAVYTPAADLVEIFGDKVEIHDADDTRMQGKYVRYDMRTGTFKIRSRVDGVEADSP